MINILEALGIIFVLIGIFFNVVGSIGLIRFPSYFVRMHAATVAVMGGCVVPLVGVALLSFGKLGWEGIVTALGAMATGAFIFLTSPVSSHAIARAATRRKIDRRPIYYDHLEEDKG